MAMHEVELWILVDESGDYVAAREAADLAVRYEEEIGGGPELARRVIQVKVKVPVESFVTLCGVAPAEGEASLSVDGGGQ